MFEQIEVPAMQALLTLAFLAGLLVGEVKLIQVTTQIAKTVFELTGKKVVGVSFIIGVVYGGLFFGLGYSEVSSYPVYVQIILGVVYVLMAGLYASGFYDLTTEPKKPDKKPA